MYLQWYLDRKWWVCWGMFHTRWVSRN
jgi:hypothetical protein